MDYYEKQRRVKLDLNQWLSDDSRSDFSLFAQKYGDLYGFDEKLILKIFEKFFPKLTIKDGQPIKSDYS